MHRKQLARRSAPPKQVLRGTYTPPDESSDDESDSDDYDYDAEHRARLGEGGSSGSTRQASGSGRQVAKQPSAMPPPPVKTSPKKASNAKAAGTPTAMTEDALLATPLTKSNIASISRPSFATPAISKTAQSSTAMSPPSTIPLSASATKPVSHKSVHPSPSHLPSPSRGPTITLTPQAIHSSLKPLSSVSANGRTQSIDSLDGNDVSDAETESASVAGWPGKRTVIRKTTEERIAFFKSDPFCRQLTPHTAECSNCNQWIHLHEIRKYVMKEWIAHRKICKGGMPPSPISPTSPSSITQVDNTRTVSREGSVAASTDTPQKHKRLNKGDRIAILEADPYVGRHETHAIECTGCGNWIRLGAKGDYTLGNWNVHRARCVMKTKPGDAIPLSSAKIAHVNASILSAPGAPDDATFTEEDMDKLAASDPQIASFSRKVIICSYCRQTITSENEYDLSNWHQHKLSCTITSPASTIASSSKRPLSSASTDMADGFVFEAPGTPSRKRAREGDEEDEEEERVSGRVVRQRSESYKPAQGLWQRITAPLWNLIEGFRHGLDAAKADKTSTTASPT
ncbi:hypothetical protein ABKN59_009095 [Abortiporus biennis]